MDPFTLALLSGGLSAAGSIGSGLLGRRKGTETGEQKRDRAIIDQILQGISGEGQFADLFGADEDIFNRLYGDPARSRFQNQTAPQIQQEFIASGQQRGTGLEDTLTRAGVDMDTLLNQQFGQFQQGAQDRQASALSGILGQRTGAQPRQSFGSALGESASGFVGSNAFEESLKGLIQGFKDRKGFSQ